MAGLNRPAACCVTTDSPGHSIVSAMDRPVFPIRIVMQRRKLVSRWTDEVWETHGVVRGQLDEPVSIEPILQSEECNQYLVKGFRLELFRDEAEGYYLNVSAHAPKVFIMWRKEDGQEIAMPVMATLSYGEAARGMDASENVDAVPMPAEIFTWVGEYVEQNYHPEPKKQRNGDKPSFQSKR